MIEPIPKRYASIGDTTYDLSPQPTVEQNQKRTCRSTTWGLGLISLLGWGFLSVSPYADGPPPGHTGGFGEPTCQHCHFDAPLNDLNGQLHLEGVPPVYTKGQTYTLKVILNRIGMERGGFQLAARFESGTYAGLQAGRLHPGNKQVTLTRSTDPSNQISYAHHTLSGTSLAASDTALWLVNWTPTDSTLSPVTFHVTANAANGDDSEFGDFIYTLQAASQPSK